MYRQSSFCHIFLLNLMGELALLQEHARLEYVFNASLYHLIRAQTKPEATLYVMTCSLLWRSDQITHPVSFLSFLKTPIRELLERASTKSGFLLKTLLFRVPYYFTFSGRISSSDSNVIIVKLPAINPF